MKAIFLLLILATLLTACATSEKPNSEPGVSYGGSYRARGSISHGVPGK